jgi:brefeldin A-inhibited guanine nucleotide-exchange protein
VALVDAVDSLKTFQTEEWPRELAKMPPPPEWMDPEPGSPLVQDDPISRHVMPEAVTKILKAYIMVLTHPYKTNRAIDMTLDCITTLIAERYVSGRAGLNVENSMSSSLDGDEPAPAPPSLLQRLIEAITECADINVETIQVGVVKSVSAIMTSPKCGIHEACMLKAIRATFHVYLVTKSPNCKSIGKSSLLEMIQSVFSFMETYDVMSKSQADASLDAFAAQYTADAYLLFRALCKLSSKNIDESKAGMLTNFVSSGGPVDPMALQSKTLSLELLLALLDDAGEAFCTSEKFIYAVQNYLCVSLLKNCTSGDTQVAYLSQKIFLVLVRLLACFFVCDFIYTLAKATLNVYLRIFSLFL